MKLTLHIIVRRLPDGTTQWKFSQGVRNPKPRIYTSRHQAERHARILFGRKPGEPTPQDVEVVTVEL